MRISVVETKNVIVVNYAKSSEEEIKVLNHYLNENGFKIATYGPMGFDPCPWHFINLDNKSIAIGKPGVKYAEPYKPHAVLVEEFIFINEIYKTHKTLEIDIVNKIFEKYKGLNMHQF